MSSDRDSQARAASLGAQYDPARHRELTDRNLRQAAQHRIEGRAETVTMLTELTEDVPADDVRWLLVLLATVGDVSSALSRGQSYLGELEMVQAVAGEWRARRELEELG